MKKIKLLFLLQSLMIKLNFAKNNIGKIFKAELFFIFFPEIFIVFFTKTQKMQSFCK